MNRRFVRTPLARVGAAAGSAYLAVALAVLLAVFCTGCTGSFGPPSDTNPPYSVEGETTPATGPGLGTFRFDIGLAAANDPLHAWTKAAERLHFDQAAGLTFGIDLDYLPDGSVKWFFVQATTGDGREVRVVWPDQQGTTTYPDHAFIETTPTSAMDTNPPTAYSVYSALSVLGSVGPGNIFAKLPAPGEGGHYGMSFPVDLGYMQAYALPKEDPGYVWDGHSFQTADLTDPKYAQEDRYLCVVASSMVFIPESERPEPNPDLMATTAAYESTGLSYFVIPLDEDAARVQDYFAGPGARYVEGLTVKNIQVTGEFPGRTLSLTFAGDGSKQAAESFGGLYYMSTSNDGWPTELNKAGLDIAWIRMEFDYGDGTTPETLEVDIAGHGVAGSTRIRPGPSTTATTERTADAPRVAQLRIANIGQVAIAGLVIRFPGSSVDFGDVPAGGVSEYRDAPGGVYRYAAYSYAVDGATTLQKVTDWVGEEPMPGTAFTYRVELDSGREVGDQLRLLGVTVDRP